MDGNRSTNLTNSKPQASRLTDEERADCVALMVRFTDDRLERVADHRRRLEREGRRLGRAVAEHRVTLIDAQRCLNDLVFELDPEVSVPLALVRYREARDMARQAFRAGFAETS